MKPFISQNHNTFLVNFSSSLQDNHILMENSSSSLETRKQLAHKKRTTPEDDSACSFQSKNKKQKETKTDKVNDGENRDNKPIMEGEISKGYIRVRARRGQATDSHSISERIRREKISARMKTLQDLVPGYDKVIGKASMLDEIINYVQYLQNQVEYLSMKLASVMPMTCHDYCLQLYEQTESLLDPTLILGEISNTQHDSGMFALPGEGERQLLIQFDRQ